jgi:thiol-disulfide isomerase/thioredoxin
MTPILVPLALVVLATAIGFLWRSRQGRVSTATGEAHDFAAPGARVTLLQFSTEVCAPCKATHAVLERAAERDGVAHVDVDVTHRPDIASRFGILQTPTTLVLDANGAVTARIGGAIRAATINDLLERTAA